MTITIFERHHVSALLQYITTNKHLSKPNVVVCHQSVIHDLVKRYILKRQRMSNELGVNEDDINEIKQDISSFRYELLEILSNNGMRLPSIMNTAHLSKTSHVPHRRNPNLQTFC